MDFRDNTVSVDESEQLCFQIIDWYHFDYNNEETNEHKYLIKMFGVTEDGYSI